MQTSELVQPIQPTYNPLQLSTTQRRQLEQSVTALQHTPASALNRLAGLGTADAKHQALELHLVAGLNKLFGLGSEAGGLLLSGSAMANFGAIVAARGKTGQPYCNASIYLSESARRLTENSIELAGLRCENIRIINTDKQFNLDTAHLEMTLSSDIRAGLHPMMIVATTHFPATGNLEPLRNCANIASHFRTWYHIEVTASHLARLENPNSVRCWGMEHADSIAIDADEDLFLPRGLGALLLADASRLPVDLTLCRVPN